MIISGLQTGNTRWLAAHLQNAADNESIEIAEVIGTVATDIDGALAEFDLRTAGTMAKEGVYAAFISPPEPLTREQYMRAIEVIEQALGLEGQPRIVLFHEKEGREHCHIAWSRIDVKNMKAIQLSFDRQKLRKCAQQLAAEFGTELPPGLKEDRGAARFDQPKQPTKAEKSMAEISGISVAERRAAITACYRQADGTKAFQNALEAAGYMLAKGDKRCFVVVDIAGHVHSLARQIDGAKTRDVKAKLEGIALHALPPVEKAKALMAQRAAAQCEAAKASVQRREAAEQTATKLKSIQKQRKAKLDLLWQQMKVRQMHEWKVLLAHIKAEEKRILRRHWTQVGLAKYLKKIAVIRELIKYYADRKKRSLDEYHTQLKASLKRRHENEARELARKYDALFRLVNREWAMPVFTGYLGAVGAGGAVMMTGGWLAQDTYRFQDGPWSGVSSAGLPFQLQDDQQPFADQDPRDYLRPALAYESVYGDEFPAEAPDHPGDATGLFDEIRFGLSGLDDMLAEAFNNAAIFAAEERLSEDETEEEKAGAHSHGPGHSYGPGPP